MISMINVLWIALCAPYDNVAHAGGQNFNYYLKKLNKEKQINLEIISFCDLNEYKQLNFDKYDIQGQIFCAESEMAKFFTFLNNLEMRFNPLNKYANFLDIYTSQRIIKELKKKRNSGYIPNLIILHWTQIALMINDVKKIFPNVRIFAFEEDVAFLGFKRKYDYVKSLLNKILYGYKYNRLKRKELAALSIADKVFTTSQKDKDILKNYIATKKIIPLNSYFNNNMLDFPRKYGGSKDILFFGAMNRHENFLSAIWFIDNVMPLLKQDFHFVIIGKNPPQELYKRQNSNIHILGFVDNVQIYFEKALCLVAPLVLGAGIKIKIVEALSSGIPVITNEIGIEGIDIRAGEDFLFCSSAQDYVNSINLLASHSDIMNELEINGKKFIRERFNYQKSYIRFRDYIVNTTV